LVSGKSERIAAAIRGFEGLGLDAHLGSEHRIRRISA
jgi:hypothetical protein